jgi:NAD-dependent histone deacetylase SIR2
MRIVSRIAPLTDCHRLITDLFDAGRLLRCYTQNIDGLQTRERADMTSAVIEMHGSNAELVCHKCKRQPSAPVSDFDKLFLEQGTVDCPACIEDGELKVRSQPQLAETKLMC